MHDWSITIQRTVERGETDMYTLVVIKRFKSPRLYMTADRWRDDPIHWLTTYVNNDDPSKVHTLAIYNDDDVKPLLFWSRDFLPMREM